MAFYENTVVARQDLAEKEISELREKYNSLINNSSGKVIKIENWGLISLAQKTTKQNSRKHAEHIFLIF